MATRPNAHLEREIAAAVKTEITSLDRIFGWRPKLEEAIVDVREGRLSRSEGPLLVSRLDTPRGAWIILDGYHRAIEAILAGRTSIGVEVDKFMPRIERTGGAYASYVADKVAVGDFLRSRVPPDAGHGSGGQRSPVNPSRSQGSRRRTTRA